MSRFVEKPALAAARRLLRHGALWNSGMFLWRADLFLQEAGRCEPSFKQWLRQCDRSRSVRFASRAGFTRLPDVPVDRAIMERSGRVAVVKSEFGWSDLGAWPALYDLARKDRRGNARWGNVVALDSSNNLVYCSRGLCVLEGVGGLMVVRAGDVVMVCPRRSAAGIRGIVQELRKRGLGGYL